MSSNGSETSPTTTVSVHAPKEARRVRVKAINISDKEEQARAGHNQQSYPDPILFPSQHIQYIDTRRQSTQQQQTTFAQQQQASQQAATQSWVSQQQRRQREQEKLNQQFTRHQQQVQVSSIRQRAQQQPTPSPKPLRKTPTAEMSDLSVSSSSPAPTKHLLNMGLKAGPGMPASTIIESIQRDSAILADMGFDHEEFFLDVDPEDPEAPKLFPGIVQEARNFLRANKDKEWDVVNLGGGVRRVPEMTELFEALVNVVLQEVRPAPKMIFTLRPDAASGAVRRAYEMEEGATKLEGQQ